jgi:hypothetical protein
VPIVDVSIVSRVISIEKLRTANTAIPFMEIAPLLPDNIAIVVS